MSEIISKQPNSIDEWVTQQIQLVSNTMEERQIAYPSGYAVRNGMMSAMLAIQNAKDSSGKPALQVVKKDSITKFLLEVVQHGLYANKTHFYPVVSVINSYCLRHTWARHINSSRMTRTLRTSLHRWFMKKINSPTTFDTATRSSRSMSKNLRTLTTQRFVLLTLQSSTRTAQRLVRS